MKSVAMAAALLFILSNISQAQSRKLGFVYSENLKGSAVIFGNTLMYYANADSSVNVTAMNGNSANGNSVFDNGNYGNTSMMYVDIDGNTGEGETTRNSSSADLVLPAGTNNIKLARLYWGGRALKSDFDLSNPLNQKIKIRKDTTLPYAELPAAQIDKSVYAVGEPVEYARYQCFVDITEMIKREGAGTYTVGNGAFSTGKAGDFGNYGAWCIVVVYENTDLSFNSVRVIDGFQEVYSGGAITTSPIIITGLNTPTDTLNAEDAQISIMTWEGDARWNGDFFKINNRTLSNAHNQANNPWNGSITINGEHVTSKFPNYTDQMGIDIDNFYVGRDYGIDPGSRNVSLQYGTTQDQYYSGVITSVIKIKESDLKITKTVSDSTNDLVAETNELLTYKIKGKNFGIGNANEVIVTDSLPPTMLYEPNSLIINYGPGVTAAAQTDSTDSDLAEFDTATKKLTFRLGNNADSANGGTVAALDSFEVQFKVRFTPIANGVAPPIINVARVTAVDDSSHYMVDDATATISGTIAQRITYIFTGNGNWSEASNWQDGKIPPTVLPVFSTIIINHAAGGDCVLDVEQKLATGSSLIINEDKNLTIIGSIDIIR